MSGAVDRDRRRARRTHRQPGERRRGSRGRHEVGADRAARDQDVGILLNRLGEEELELASLVARHREPGEVVALDEQRSGSGRARRRAAVPPPAGWAARPDGCGPARSRPRLALLRPGGAGAGDHQVDHRARGTGVRRQAARPPRLSAGRPPAARCVHRLSRRTARRQGCCRAARAAWLPSRGREHGQGVFAAGVAVEICPHRLARRPRGPPAARR